MNAQDWIARWVEGNAKPGSSNAALSCEAWAESRAGSVVRVLYSYNVPIAASFGDRYVVVTTKEAASDYFANIGRRGGSVTTSKHIRWVESALRGSSLFGPDQRATLTQGKVPESYEEWEPILVGFDRLLETQAPGDQLRPFRGLR